MTKDNLVVGDIVVLRNTEEYLYYCDCFVSKMGVITMEMYKNNLEYINNKNLDVIEIYNAHDITTFDNLLVKGSLRHRKSFWEDVEVDTKIHVKQTIFSSWKACHFAEYKDEKIYVWKNGKTSFSRDEGEFCDSVVSYDYGKLAEEPF